MDNMVGFKSVAQEETDKVNPDESPNTPKLPDKEFFKNLGLIPGNAQTLAGVFKLETISMLRRFRALVDLPVHSRRSTAEYQLDDNLCHISVLGYPFLLVLEPCR